jgi:uncharacterized protein (TIRG00374 family)
MSEVARTVPSHVPVSPARRQHHRWIILLLILGLGTTVLLSTFAGGAQTLALLVNANPVFVVCVIGFQALRYAAMTFSLRFVAQIVAVTVPFLQLFQVVVFAQAVNRTCVGGAAGLAVRRAFFLKRGMGGGTFVAVEGIEDVVSLGAVALMFVAGIGLVLMSGAVTGLRWEGIGLLAGGVILLIFLVVIFLRHRSWVTATADAAARAVQATLGRLLRRSFYSPERVRGGVDDLYISLELARRDPLRVLLAFGCAFARLGCDWIALYFAFLAIGFPVPLGTVLLIFIVSTSVATLVAVPGQIGVMETTLAFMSASLGVPLPAAVTASVLYRLISFWLPIPFGYAFGWNLERRGLL